MQQFPGSVQLSQADLLQFHNSLQQSQTSLQQSPAILQQSPATLQHFSVKSWKSLRPESRATLDGAPTLNAQISRAAASIAPVPVPDSVSEHQSHGPADADAASITTSSGFDQQMCAGQGRAKGTANKLQRAPAVITPLEQAVASGIAQQSSSTQLVHSVILETVAGADSHLEHASKNSFACNALPGCSPCYSSLSSEGSGGSMQHAEACSALVRTHSVYDTGMQSNADYTAVCLTVDSRSNTSSMPATGIMHFGAGTHSSTDRVKQAAASSIAVSADSFSLLKSFVPSMGAPERRSIFHAASETELLSALNSNDLAYLSESPQLPAAATEQLATNNTLKPCPLHSACISGLTAADAEDTVDALTDRPAMFSEINKVQSNEVRSALGSVRHPTALQSNHFSTHAHLLQLVGDEDVVLSGSHSEDQLQQEHSISNAIALSAADSRADAYLESSIVKARAAPAGGVGIDTADEEASSETLYDDDWEI